MRSKKSFVALVAALCMAGAVSLASAGGHGSPPPSSRHCPVPLVTHTRVPTPTDLGTVQVISGRVDQSIIARMDGGLGTVSQQGNSHFGTGVCAVCSRGLFQAVTGRLNQRVDVQSAGGEWSVSQSGNFSSNSQ